MKITRTYSIIKGHHKGIEGFFAVENGQTTSLFFKTENGAWKCAKRFCEKMTMGISRNNHEVSIVKV